MSDATRRFRHEAAVYGSDDELVALAAGFVRQGVEAGEPTFLGLGRRERDLVADALDDVTGVTELDVGDHYASPFKALEANHRLLTDQLSAGAGRVRMLGQVPGHGSPGAWDGWVRYEAAINHVYGPLEVWSLCPYDRRRTPEPVLADVERTHTHLRTVEGSDASQGYVEPAAFLARRARDAVDPLEATEPPVELTGPTPSDARRAVTSLAGTTALAPLATERLALAVTELVTNAVMHGRPPVVVRAWAATDRVVVTVRDGGPGPADPFAGYLPRRAETGGGLGLWMVNQACDQVALVPDDGGFLARVVMDAHPAG